jgi:hypothetical protein
MIESREGFVDGQITCPKCDRKFYDRGQIGGELRFVPYHDKGCKGRGFRVPLEPLADPRVGLQRCECRDINALR